MSENKITLSQWNELSDEEKEVLRKWAVAHDFGLDIIPSSSGSFDPSCDYAALLTPEQVKIFLQEHGKKDDVEDRWGEIKKVLKEK